MIINQEIYTFQSNKIICKKYNLPVVAVGMGEKETDLHPFNAEYFAKALLGIEN